jgi:hypothetical protein
MPFVDEFAQAAQLPVARNFLVPVRGSDPLKFVI